MRSYLIPLFIFLYVPFLNAQVLTPEESQEDSSKIYIMQLIDNNTLTGKIIERNGGEIVFHDINIGRVTIPTSRVKKLEGIKADQLCLITLDDGNKYTGEIMEQTETLIRFKTKDLGEITIPLVKIKTLQLVDQSQFLDGKYYFANPHPTRYFFSPSAIPLKKSEGYYQNAYILVNGVQVGLSDHFSIGGGVALPILFFVTPKFGFQLGEKWHAGGGILASSTISSDIHFGFAIGYASLTYGNTENNFTINAGWGSYRSENEEWDPVLMTYTYDDKWELSKNPMFSFAGMARISPRLALITENYVFSVKDISYNMQNERNESYKYHSVFSAGFRILGEKNSFDLALVIPSVDGSTFGLPYLDYVFKF